MSIDSKILMTALATVFTIAASLGLVAAILAQDWTFTTVAAIFTLVLLWLFLLRFLGVRVTIAEDEGQD